MAAIDERFLIQGVVVFNGCISCCMSLDDQVRLLLKDGYVGILDLVA